MGKLVGIWGGLEPKSMKKQRRQVRGGYDSFQSPTSTTPEDIERYKRSYGVIWDTMSERTKDLCKLQYVTREGYIRMNIKKDLGIDIEPIET